MKTKTESDLTLVALADLEDGQRADCFAMLGDKQTATTRDGKPYYRVTFRDRHRTVTFPIWSDAPWYAACEKEWEPGEFYKIRGVYRETQYGPQLEIEKIRPVVPEDARDGFDAADFYEQTRFDIEAMFRELVELAEKHIANEPLRRLVLRLTEEHADAIRQIPAATHNHHAFSGGYLEHVLSVTRTCVYLADKYAEYYDQLDPPLDKSLIVAGGILHDVGKVFELEYRPERSRYTAAGRLIGHILQGRDMVRDAARDVPELEPDVLLRLEHIVVAHQHLPEWGSPKLPQTLESLIVHYADDMDAKVNIMARALETDRGEGPFTSRDNPLRRHLYKGEPEGDD